MELSDVTKALDGIEQKLTFFSEKAEADKQLNGQVSEDTKKAIDNLGVKQREMAEELIQLKQRGAMTGDDLADLGTVGSEFTKSEQYKNFVEGRTQKARLEIKNTVTNAIGNTFSERKPGIVSGAFREFAIESLLPTMSTTANAVDYIRENVFTNSAAETAEGAAKPESSLTLTPVTEPVATIAHWIKITKQLASDNAALAAYINARMVYGVNLRVENQIINGNGTAPNISGFTKAGNFTAHGYTAASLTAAGLANNRFDLIGLMIGDCEIADYPADVVIMNPTDWWKMRLAKDTTNRYILGDPAMIGDKSLFGVRVVTSNAVTADNVLVASLQNAALFYNREGVTVDMSESDSDNFTKNLITIRAERRCMLAVERPAAVRYGDLTPA